MPKGVYQRKKKTVTVRKVFTSRRPMVTRTRPYSFMRKTGVWMRPINTVEQYMMPATTTSSNMDNNSCCYIDGSGNYIAHATGSWIPSTVGDNATLGITVRASDCPNFTSYAGIYDQYKISHFQVILERAYTSVDAAISTGVASTGPLNVPLNLRFHVVKDYDSVSDYFSTEQQALTYASCRSYSLFGQKPITITVYPRVLSMVDRSEELTNFGVSTIAPKWFDCQNSSAVSHLGLKIFIPDIGFSTLEFPMFRVRIKTFISFRNKSA